MPSLISNTIENIEQLWDFLNPHTLILGGVSKQQILISMANEGNLSKLIENNDQLLRFFSEIRSLFPSFMDESTQLLMPLRDKIAALIENKDQLLALLNGSPYKTDILKACEGKFGTLIKNTDCLIQLLSAVEANHKTQILTALAERLSTLVTNTECLVKLLAAVNGNQGVQILIALKEQLSLLIKDENQLKNLFSLLLPHHITNEQLAIVIKTLEKTFNKVIQNGAHLNRFLSLSYRELNPEYERARRAVVQRKVPNQYDLGFVLFSVGKQLRPDQRALIWELFEKNISTLIKDGHDLRSLFISFESYEYALEKRLWERFEGQLGTLIKDTNQLQSLLLLLNKNQCAQVWSAVEGHLSALIENEDDIDNLFALDPTILNMAQRIQILLAVEGRIRLKDPYYQFLEKYKDFENKKEQMQKHFVAQLNILNQKFNMYPKDSTSYKEGKKLYITLLAAQKEFFEKLSSLPTDTASNQAAIADFRKICADHIQAADKIMGHNWLYRINEVLIKAVIGLLAGISMLIGSLIGEGLAKPEHRQTFKNTFFTLNQTDESQILHQLRQEVLDEQKLSCLKS